MRRSVIHINRTTAQSDSSVFGQTVYFAGTAYLIAGTVAIGGTTLVIDTGTLSLSKGQVFRVQSDTTDYTIVSIGAAAERTLDPTHGTTVTSITFTPALVVEGTNNKTITPQTTWQPLPPNLVTDSVVILADSANAEAIFVGDSNVSTVNGFSLAAGASLEVKCTDSSSIYIVGAANDHVYITGS